MSKMHNEKQLNRNM